MVNAGLIRPTKEAPSPVDNTVVVEDVTNDDDVEIGTGEDDVKVQECKLEKTDLNTPKLEMDRILAGPNGGMFINNVDQ